MRPLSVPVSPTANVLTTVYTVPKGYYAQMSLIYIHNGGAGNKHITFSWTDTSASVTYELLTQFTVNSKTNFIFDNGAYIVLEEGDIIKVLTEAGSTFTVVCTFEEIGLTRQ